MPRFDSVDLGRKSPEEMLQTYLKKLHADIKDYISMAGISDDDSVHYLLESIEEKYAKILES
jgi:hypothetical protein